MVFAKGSLGLPAIVDTVFVSLEERLLFCLPPRYPQRSCFGREKRSVQARASLLEVTTGSVGQKAAGPRPPGRAFGDVGPERDTPRESFFEVGCVQS